MSRERKIPVWAAVLGYAHSRPQTDRTSADDGVDEGLPIAWVRFRGSRITARRGLTG